MNISGQYELTITPEQAWDAMMDPQVLTQCIPACQQISKQAEDTFQAQVKVKFGIIPLKFDVDIDLSAIEKPNHYVLSAKAKGGMLDGAKATGRVEFIQLDNGGTKVDFIGDVLPGSKLFELGEPLVQKTAGKWFNRFFQRFEIVTGV